MREGLKRRRGHTRLSTNNQVTLPKAVVAALGLAQGAEFRVEARAGQVVLSPIEDQTDHMRRVLAGVEGRFSGLYEPGYLDRLRDEW